MERNFKKSSKKHIWGFSKVAHRVSVREMAIARRYAMHRRRSFADMLARAIFDDMHTNRYGDGGTFYMDGRRLYPDNGDYYAVGGASDDTEIMLSKDEINSELDVKAAIELLREEIVKLDENDPKAPVGIGYWEDSGYYYFDVSNIVEGKNVANQMALARGEKAFFSFSTGESIPTNTINACRFSSKSWAKYNRARRASVRKVR